MKHRSSRVAFAVLLALSLTTPLALADSGADNPECLGSSCGRPNGTSALDAGSLLERVWAEIFAVFY